MSAQAPPSPVYPFNAPSQPVGLYRGGIGGLTAGDLAGSVELRLVPDVAVEWAVDDPFAAPRFSSRRGEIPLTLHRPAGDMDRMIAHWFNLPDWRRPGYSMTSVAAAINPSETQGLEGALAC